MHLFTETTLKHPLPHLIRLVCLLEYKIWLAFELSHEHYAGFFCHERTAAIKVDICFHDFFLLLQFKLNSMNDDGFFHHVWIGAQVMFMVVFACVPFCFLFLFALYCMYLYCTTWNDEGFFPRVRTGAQLMFMFVFVFVSFLICIVLYVMYLYCTPWNDDGFFPDVRTGAQLGASLMQTSPAPPSKQGPNKTQYSFENIKTE